MKTKTKGLLSLLLALTGSAVALTACEDVNKAVNDQQHQCGETLSDHAFGAKKEEVPATCETDGSYKQTCSACGYTETVVVLATGHAWENVEFTWVGDEATVSGTCDCGVDLAEDATVTVETIDTATCAHAGAIVHTATATYNEKVVATDFIALNSPQKSHFVSEYTHDESDHWRAKKADCNCQGVELIKESHDISVSYDIDNEKTIKTCDVCDWTDTFDGIANMEELRIGKTNTFALSAPIAFTQYLGEYEMPLDYDPEKGYCVSYDPLTYKQEADLIEGEDYLSVGGTAYTTSGEYSMTFVAPKTGHYTFTVADDTFASVIIYQYVTEPYTYLRLCPVDASSDGFTATVYLTEGMELTIETTLVNPMEDPSNTVSYIADYYAFSLDVSYEFRGLPGSSAEMAIDEGTDGFEVGGTLKAGESVYYNLSLSDYAAYAYKTFTVGGYGMEVYVNNELVTLDDDYATPAIRFTSEKKVLLQIKNTDVEAGTYSASCASYTNPAFNLKKGDNEITVPTADLLAGIHLSFTLTASEKVTLTLSASAETDKIYASQFSYMGETFIFGWNDEEGEFTASSEEYVDAQTIGFDFKTLSTTTAETITFTLTVDKTDAGTEANPRAVKLFNRTNQGYAFVPFTDTIKIPAGASYYYSTNVGNFTGNVMVTVIGTAKLTVNDNVQEYVSGTPLVNLPAQAVNGSVVFTNEGSEEITVKVSLAEYVDAKDNLAVDFNTIYLTEEQATEGYEITFTAPKAGIYTFYFEELVIVAGGNVTIASPSMLSMPIEKNDVFVFTVFADMAGFNEIVIMYEPLPEDNVIGSVDNLVVGRNDIVIPVESAFFGVEGTFTAPEDGTYFFVPTGENFAMTLDTSYGPDMVEINASNPVGTYTLTEGQQLGIAFCTGDGETAANYSVEIGLVGSYDNLVVGLNNIAVPVESAYIGLHGSITATKAGTYTFAVYGENVFVGVDESYGPQATSLTSNGETCTYTVAEGETVTFLFATADEVTATDYQFVITFEEAASVGSKEALVVGENAISLSASEAYDGYEATFTAPTAGEYTFTVDSSADASIVFNYGAGFISPSDGYSYVITLTEGEELPVIFMSYSENAAEYTLTISYSAE